LQRPVERALPSESDSDTAPSSAIVDHKEETPEERRLREVENLEESARDASS
jgi:hypothetical protein